MKQPAEPTPDSGAARHLRPLRLVFYAALLLAAVPAGAAAQRNSTEGSISGRVLEDQTGAAVASAQVQLLDHVGRIRRQVVTDGDGKFLIERIQPGPFVLRVTRIGYMGTETPYWQVKGGEMLTVVVRVARDAIVLAPLEITARANSSSPVLANFYRRLRRGTEGLLLGRDEIERRAPALVTDLLVDVPGLRLQGDRNSRIVSFARAIPGIGSGCPVQVWVDGVIARNARLDEGVVLDELATPSGLEGIEVYRGISTVPAEFLNEYARCGVIALWTRRGG